MTFQPCLVIPFYNHGEGMARTIEALSGYGLHCFAIDDGSDGPNAEQLATAARNHPWVTVARMKKNSGKGAAVMLGLELALKSGYSHALQMDADEQHEPADVPRLLEIARDNPRALVAGRPIFDQTLPVARRWCRRITHFWVGLETLSLRPPDTMCGFRVYPLEATVALMQSTRLGQRMDFDIEVMVRLIWAGVPLVTLPVRIHYPAGGKSHFRYVHDNLHISWMHTRLVFGTLRRFPSLLATDARTQERSRHHWSDMKERGALAGIRLLVWTYRFFGRNVYHLVLLPVMTYFFVTGGEARRASRTFLARAYQAGSPHRAMQRCPTLRTSFRHFLAFGHSAIDTMAAWVGDLSERDLVFANRDSFTRVAASGTGAVVIGSHLGNMNVCRALADQDAAARLTVLMFTEHALAFNKVLRNISPRAAEGVIFLEGVRPETGLMLQEKIAAGGIVVLLGDRTSASARTRVSYAPFLGHPAPLPQGPFILANLLKCPVYLMFCLKVHRKYHVHFEPFEACVDIGRNTRGTDLQRLVERYAGRLEHYALKEPLQWFNFFDFWYEPRKNRTSKHRNGHAHL